jgi:hypothetical protein
MGHEEITLIFRVARLLFSFSLGFGIFMNFRRGQNVIQTLPKSELR